MTPQRREPGIRRRLRLPWIRSTLREKAAQEAGRPQHPDRPPVMYGGFWVGRNALSKASTACQCSMCKLGHPRYRDVDRQREKRVAA